MPRCARRELGSLLGYEAGHRRAGARESGQRAVHDFFQKDFVLNSLLGNREYLFDQVPALMAVFDGVQTVDQLVAALGKMSLVDDGLLGKPTAPMLVLAGVLDTQVPISDIYRLLDKGDTPKIAWINPQGGHLGRQTKVWPGPRIFREVIIPWLVRALDARNPDSMGHKIKNQDLSCDR